MIHYYKSHFKKIPQLAAMITARLAYFKLIGTVRDTSFFIPLLLLLLASCTSDNKAKKFKIGFSQTDNDLWRQTMLVEMKRELSFHDNIDFLYYHAGGNSQTQVKQIEELVQEGIDMLIVSPNEAQPLTAAVEKVYETGIPVVIIDRRINSEKFTAFIGASNFEVGQNAARYAVSLLKGKGNVIEVMGLPSASPFIDRHRGFMDIISKNEGINYLKNIDDHSPDYEKNLEHTLLNNDNIDLIFAQSDFIASFVYKACKRLGLEKKFRIIGVDGLPVDTLGMGMVANKYITATVVYPTGGQEAIITAANILEKKPFNRETPLTTTIIDSTNVRIMMLQHEKMLAQEKDIDKRQKRIEEQIAITENQSNIIVAISISLALALIFGGILFYYLKENKKINKKLEFQNEEIARQRNQLIELMEKVKEATDAKFNFFTNISHELRTPLTLILGPLEDAMSSPKLHFTVKNNLDFIHRNTIRLLRLINQLMDFRKLEETKMKLNASENNVTVFVTEITNAFKDIARKKSIFFNVNSKVKDLTLWFDVNMLDKVLFNLLSNAFKFTEENGSITVTIDRSPDGKFGLIKVEDTGVGMSTEDVEHAFDVFYQGHSSTFKGTGLGLALSKELIQVHHGNITIKSEKDKGTLFEINLPTGKSHLQPDEILSEKTKQASTLYEDTKIYTTDMEPPSLQDESSEVTKGEYSILLIEDNDDLRAFLKRRLGDNYELHEAENSEKGIAKAFDIVPDLIISDIILPGQNGLFITETLKHDIRTSHIPVILLTAKSSMEEQIEGIRSQADAFITKPFNLEYLEETIKNLLKNRAVLREHYTSELPTEAKISSSNKIDRKFITEFTAIVENNLSNEDFSVDDICKKIGISRVQLYRKVKALIGYNVNDYILTVRLKKAKFLLSSGDLTISEVASKVGFSSQGYFSTVFKSKFGVTPSEFKEKKKEIS